jgi:hypothetical protein
MIVSFIYQVNNEKYYGKYIGNIATNYEEGLDIEIQNKIFPLLKPEYNLESENDLVVGILFYTREKYEYFSEKESRIFDLIYCDWSNQPKEIYLNKKLIK